MIALPMNTPLPPDATDLALGIPREHVAFITNRVVTLRDGDQVMCPNGWDLFFDGHIVMLVYNNNSEVENA